MASGCFPWDSATGRGWRPGQDREAHIVEGRSLMIGFKGKGHFLYLRGGRLLGAEWKGGRLKKTLDCPSDRIDLTRGLSGRAVLLVQNEALQHQVVSVPSGMRGVPRSLMANEAQELAGASTSELALGWRVMGAVDEEGLPKDQYLLAVHPRASLQGLLERLGQLGLKVHKVTSALDLLIEYAGRKEDGSARLLIVFEQETVQVLFFQGRVYRFHRSLPGLYEGIQEDLILEIQRSAYYAKQRYKIPVEKVSILLAPSWFSQEVASSLGSALQIPVDFLTPRAEESPFPELGVLNLALNDPGLFQPLLSILPPHIMRSRSLRRVAAICTATELILLCLVLLSILNHRAFREGDMRLLRAHATGLRALEENLRTREGELVEMNRFRQGVQDLREVISKRPHLHVHLEALAYLVPDCIHLDSIQWSSPEAAARTARTSGRVQAAGDEKLADRIQLTGGVEGKDAGERYSLFFGWIERLKEEPLGPDLSYGAEGLLERGTFKMSIPRISK